MQWPTSVFVATQPIDMRLSFDRIAGIVRAQLGQEPRTDSVFVFHNKRLTHVKLLWHDGTGYRILFKRLDRGRFRIPTALTADGQRVQVSHRELHLILEGIDTAAIRAAQRSVRFN